MRVIFDSHPGMVLGCPFDQINGWVERPLGTNLSFRIGSHELPYATYARPDLNSGTATAFTAYIDFLKIQEARSVSPGSVRVDVLEDGFPIHTTELVVSGMHPSDWDRIREQKEIRRLFVEKNWKGAPPKQLDGISALNALPDGWSLEPRIANSADLVCRHHYDSMIYDFLKNDGKPGMFLEIGSGLRFWPSDNVVTVEIYDYPSTDVLSVAETLPFQDATFDGALALNVLEHVRNPFVCAKELCRVVKPGGKIYIMIPFMAPEHGYPSHYFNATRFGVLELFKSCGVETQIVHPSSHPIGALGNMLSVYAGGLSGNTRNDFMRMSVSDLLRLAGSRDHRIVSEMDPETAFKVAWGTTTIFVNQ